MHKLGQMVRQLILQPAQAIKAAEQRKQPAQTLTQSNSYSKKTGVCATYIPECKELLCWHLHDLLGSHLALFALYGHT